MGRGAWSMELGAWGMERGAWLSRLVMRSVRDSIGSANIPGLSPFRRLHKIDLEENPIGSIQFSLGKRW